MATRWSKKSSHNNSAPTTLFSNVLSPRQLANKTITLGYKKLDRDSKRQRPLYNFRIHVLISNTIAKAENVLNKRTRRTNRRVMAAEEGEEDDFIDMMMKNHPQKNHGTHMTTAAITATTINKKDNKKSIKKSDSRHHSPLRSCSSLTTTDQHQSLSSSAVIVSTSLSIKTTKNDINDIKVREGTDDHNKKDEQATKAMHPMTEPSCHSHSSISVGVSSTSLSCDCKSIVIQSATTPIESII